jgi:hypothetical protein
LGNVELAQNVDAEGGDLQHNYNSADTLKGNAYAGKAESGSSQKMKKCFCGITIAGILIISTIIIIVIAVSGSSKKESCPPYHYRDPDAVAEEIHIGGEVMNEDGGKYDIEQDQGVCVRGRCDFRFEIMIDDGAACQTCENGTVVNGMGTKCI